MVVSSRAPEYLLIGRHKCTTVGPIQKHGLLRRAAPASLGGKTTLPARSDVAGMVPRPESWEDSQYSPVIVQAALACGKMDSRSGS